ncbi:MAG: hypothetical protein NUV56_03670 [Candidatus Uhrbacteria bacterium]|nr:hypothetical protein [Candidatus Uhrbacteria bacterium]
MTKGGSLILRIYFGVVSAVTLFTLMWGAIDMLTIGLKTYVIKAADVPEYGLENCENPGARYAEPVKEDGSDVTDEEAKAMCERRNDDTMANYRRQKASNAVRDIATVIVSLPLFLTHFRIVYRDWAEERKAAKA